MRGPFDGGIHTIRICCCSSGSRSIARSPSCCCCSPPRLCCCSTPIKPHFSRLNRLLGQLIFRGWGRLAGVKEESPAVGTGACRRGTPLSILGFRMGAVVTGGGGALAGRWRGDRRRKSSAWGGLEGWPGRRRTGGRELFRGGRWWLAAQGGAG